MVPLLALLVLLPSLAMAQGETRVKVIGTTTITGTVSGSSVTIGPITAEPTFSSRTCTTTSMAVFAPKADRKAIQCIITAANTDDVCLQWANAALSTDMCFERGSSWTNPQNAISTSTLNCRSASGSQVIRCWQW